jgi:hypothetical protein
MNLPATIPEKVHLGLVLARFLLALPAVSTAPEKMALTADGNNEIYLVNPDGSNQIIRFSF